MEKFRIELCLRTFLWSGTTVGVISTGVIVSRVSVVVALNGRGNSKGSKALRVRRGWVLGCNCLGCE